MVAACLCVAAACGRGREEPPEPKPGAARAREPPPAPFEMVDTAPSEWLHPPRPTRTAVLRLSGASLDAVGRFVVPERLAIVLEPRAGVIGTIELTCSATEAEAKVLDAGGAAVTGTLSLTPGCEGGSYDLGTDYGWLRLWVNAALGDEEDRRAILRSWVAAPKNARLDRFVAALQLPDGPERQAYQLVRAGKGAEAAKLGPAADAALTAGIWLERMARDKMGREIPDREGLRRVRALAPLVGGGADPRAADALFETLDSIPRRHITQMWPRSAQREAEQAAIAVLDAIGHQGDERTMTKVSPWREYAPPDVAKAAEKAELQVWERLAAMTGTSERPRVGVRYQIAARGDKRLAIEPLLEKHLRDAGLDIVAFDATPVDGLLLVEYREEAGGEFGPGGAALYTGTKVTATLTLWNLRARKMLEPVVTGGASRERQIDAASKESIEDLLYADAIAGMVKSLDRNAIGTTIAAALREK